MPDNSSTQQASSSTNSKEVAKFAALANEWWNPRGPFKALHELNDARIEFLRSVLRVHKQFASDSDVKYLSGLRVLDVGCGGGILSEALARLGGNVTGIDVTRENIEVAKQHMKHDVDLQDCLRYAQICLTACAKSPLTDAPQLR
jgi:ubiquinone biosynthesis O-methyltransferase